METDSRFTDGVHAGLGIAIGITRIALEAITDGAGGKNSAEFMAGAESLARWMNAELERRREDYSGVVQATVERSPWLAPSGWRMALLCFGLPFCFLIGCAIVGALQ